MSYALIHVAFCVYEKFHIENDFSYTIKKDVKNVSNHVASETLRVGYYEFSHITNHPYVLE